jgi:serine/threonine protein kinase
MTDERSNRDNGQPDGDEVHIEPGSESEVEPAITSDDERLVALASQIDQGHAIDWEAAERDARDDRERAIISEMRLLADVARVGREHAIVADQLLADFTRVGRDGTLDADAAAARGAEAYRADPYSVAARGLEAFGPNAASVNADHAAAHGADARGGESFWSEDVKGQPQSEDETRRQEGRPPIDTPPATWGSLTIQEPIGRGAFATVYRAQDNLGRLVALKLFSLPREHAIDWTARLLHEGRLLARLRHENVVTIYGADQGDGYVGLWMEFVKGRTLEEELHTRVRFSADEAVQVGRVLCRALAAVHREGLLHRDVKAHNVMRDDAGRIVLMDFGSGREARIDLTSPNLDLAGTPLYLAPEVFAGQPASIASDIYSLGVLLFHLVSDRYPVEGTNRSEIQRAHLERRRLWLRDARPDLPEAFVRVVERALASERTQRYQSAGELEDALGGISMQPSAASSGGSSAPVVAATPLTPPTPPPAIGDPSPKLPPRYRWQMLAAGAAFILAVVMLVVVGPRFLSQRPPPASTRGDVPLSPQTPTQPQTARDLAPYAVHATFFKHRDDGVETPLTLGDRIAPRDKLGLRIEMSKPAYVYVANQDEEGNAFLLYPVRTDITGPLAADREHRLPEDDNGKLWVVTSAGVREHLLVFVSQTVLKDFNTLLRDLPRVSEGRAVTPLRIPASLIGQTRGVGGLAQVTTTTPSELQRLFKQAQPLSEYKEATEGEWIRRLTLTNPVARRRPATDPPTSPSH